MYSIITKYKLKTLMVVFGANNIEMHLKMVVSFIGTSANNIGISPLCLELSNVSKLIQSYEELV